MSDSVQIWQIQLEVSQDTLKKHFMCLSKEEKSRANRFRFADDRRRFIVSRGALRRILAHQFDQPSHKIDFCYGEYGKPFIRQFPDCRSDVPGVTAFQSGCDFHFNLTHSGEIALCAVGYQHKVGIDIERIKLIRRLESLMERCLSNQEKAQVKAEAAHDQPRAFLQLWTCKEAYLKAIGLGLTESMQMVEVKLAPPQLIRVPQNCSGGWYLHTLALPDGYVGALVVAAEVTLELCQWQHEGVLNR